MRLYFFLEDDHKLFSLTHYKRISFMCQEEKKYKLVETEVEAEFMAFWRGEVGQALMELEYPAITAPQLPPTTPEGVQGAEEAKASGSRHPPVFVEPPLVDRKLLLGCLLKALSYGADKEKGSTLVQLLEKLRALVPNVGGDAHCHECKVHLNLSCHRGRKNATARACGFCVVKSSFLGEIEERSILSATDIDNLIRLATDLLPDASVRPPSQHTVDPDGCTKEIHDAFPVEDFGVITSTVVNAPFGNTGTTAIPESEVVDWMAEAGADITDSGDFERVVEAYGNLKDVTHKEQKTVRDSSGKTEAQRQRTMKKVAATVVKEGLNPTNPQCYPQFNLLQNSSLSEWITEHWMKKAQGGDGMQWAWAQGMNFPHRQNLCMLASAGNWTPMHVDWTHAVNVAFGVGDTVDPMKPLARWYFFHPRAIPLMNDWLKETGRRRELFRSDGLRCGKDKMPRLTQKDIEELQAVCKEENASYVSVRHQYHGDMLQFQPGYLHQVETLQPCIKFAWDVYKVDKLEQYVDVWRYLMCQLMAHTDNPQDYMNFLGLIVKELLNPSRACRPMSSI